MSFTELTIEDFCALVETKYNTFHMKLISLLAVTLTLLPSWLIADESQFQEYWMSGKAELVSYQLSQTRYGAKREGYAVAIWVTEDLDNIKQVKLDAPEKTPESDKVKVLKLNFIRRFTTGLYDYSLMRSTFQPLNLEQYQYPLKTTFTAQDWCGQVMWQLNNRNDEFELIQLSYFESDGDRRKLLPEAFSEDQVWTQLRIDPRSLPTGDFMAYPAVAYSRLEHREYKALPAFATMDVNGTTNEIVYSLGFPSLHRTIKWHVAGQFPYRLLRWSEEFVNSKGQQVSSTAVQKEVLHTDYWNKSAEKFLDLRSTFRVPTFDMK